MFEGHVDYVKPELSSASNYEFLRAANSAITPEWFLVESKVYVVSFQDARRFRWYLAYGSYDAVRS